MFKDYEDAMYALNDLVTHNPTHRVDEINRMTFDIAGQFRKNPWDDLDDLMNWRPTR